MSVWVLRMESKCNIQRDAICTSNAEAVSPSFNAALHRFTSTARKASVTTKTTQHVKQV